MSPYFFSSVRFRPNDVVKIGQQSVRVLGFQCIKGKNKELKYKCYFERCGDTPTSGLEKLTQCVDSHEIHVLESY